MSSEDKHKKKSKTESLIRLYSIFHVAMIVYALIVSYKCNNGINPVAAVLAIMCPHLYLMYIAATKGLGFCFLMGNPISIGDGEGEGEEE
tara:strand:+ start:299 stop:568 length:270 start_codon:yes stop_codon:yes gene_type:complete